MNSTAKKKKKQSNFAYDFVKITGVIPALIWLRPRIIRASEKVPKKIKGGAIVAANHTSFLDPIIVHLAFLNRRLHCLATKDLYDTPTKKKFFELMHCIIVDKENFNMSSLHSVCDRLKEEKLVVIFPEGYVNREDDKVQDYKSGAVLMAHIGKKPIVPVYIVKPKRWYNRVTIMIGEPIDVASICGKIPTMDKIDEASKFIHDKEIELATIYESKFNKGK